MPKAALLAFVAPVLAGTAMAQDECSGAANIALDTPTPFDTTAATNNAADPAFGCGGGSPANDIWFEFTAPASYTATVTTCNTATYDTRLSVWSGSCGALVSEGCNDDLFGTCSGNTSQLDVALVAGTQYWVRVAGFNTATGMGDLLVTGPPPPPDECVDADPITPDVPEPIDTTVATTTAAPDFSCAAGGGDLLSPDLWYTFTATDDYMATASTCGTVDYDSKIEVYSGDCVTLVSEACNDDGTGCAGFSSETSWMAVNGTQYWIRVGGYTAGDTGTGTLLVTGPPPAIANDECSGAIALADGVAEPFDNTLATFSSTAPAPSCGGFSDPLDLWYSITPLADGSITVDTLGSTGLTDTRLEVYSGDCGSLVSIDCNDDIGSPNFLSSITFAGTAFETYYVRVGGFGGSSGAGQVTATFVDSLANDDCSGAIAISVGTTPYSNVGATESGNTQSCAFGTSTASEADVWFSWTAPSDCTMQLDTDGSDFDTTVSVYSGDCMALVEEACDDDGGAGLQSLLTFNAIGGTTYLIQAGSFNGATGNGLINLDAVVTPGIASLVCAGVPNSTGLGGVLSAAGSLVATDNDLTLTANCLPANVNCLLVNSSTTATLVNNPGGSLGNLCIASFEMGRHGIANSGAAGSVDYVLDTTSLPTNITLVAAMAGDTWYFQVWHREGMSDSNFTSAIQVDFE